MTLVPVFKKCSRCKKVYSWNPDVGKLLCPNCGLLGTPKSEDVHDEKIWDIVVNKKKK